MFGEALEAAPKVVPAGVICIVIGIPRSMAVGQKGKPWGPQEFGSIFPFTHRVLKVPLFLTHSPMLLKEEQKHADGFLLVTGVFSSLGKSAIM